MDLDLTALSDPVGVVSGGATLVTEAAGSGPAVVCLHAGVPPRGLPRRAAPRRRRHRDRPQPPLRRRHPSRDDEAITRRLGAAGDLVGVEVLDHMVIGHQRWTSLARRGVLMQTDTSRQFDEPSLAIDAPVRRA